MKNIVLIGFMGAGKTEVGRRLAEDLGWPFEDADFRIEERERLSIPEIFEKHGEAYFRKREREIIAELAGKKSCIIATGGGAAADSKNRRALGRNGLLIHLDASPDVVLSRTAVSDRPLLQGGDRLQRIHELLGRRRPSYTLSDHRIDTSQRSPAQVASMIKNIASASNPIRVDIGGRGYAVEIAEGGLSKIGGRLREEGIRGKVAVVTNTRVGRLYGAAVTRSLKKAGFETLTVTLPDGERYKNLKSISHIYDALIRGGLERGSTIVALGGGVIGDMAGFAAATYLRGISCVQVPTTLAAQVDASIGGKTGVDHPLGKNLIGAFHQPRMVYIDPEILNTLTRREFVSGLAEVIKYGVIRDEEFFEYLEDNMDKILRREPAALTHAIRRSCAIKAEVVSRDEREGDLRRILNFGHTYGHALETATRYRVYLHGEAVSLGMAMASRLASRLGHSTAAVSGRLITLLSRAGLPVDLPKIKTADILKNMKLDKKVAGGRIYFVLAESIGKVRVEPVDSRIIAEELGAGSEKS